MDEIRLRYGTNPHQQHARVYVPEGKLPIEVLNGEPGYINLLDALNSWQLVKELKALAGIAAAASFKHTSPAGAAIGKPLTEELKKSLFIDEDELSPLACAYARARGADPMSSFGDWAAFSDPVDEPAARLLVREVSDGCIAPDYEPRALALLKNKKQGKYPILKIDPGWQPPPVEIRQLFGVYLEQQRNDARIDHSLLANVVTQKKQIPAAAALDLLIASITLKYTQSNSVGLAYDGQVIGVAAGQQSRIHCTRLACIKAEKWLLRLHPALLDIKFRKGTTRAERATAIDLLLEEISSVQSLRAPRSSLPDIFTAPTPRLTLEQRQEWFMRFSGICLGSDGFIPFRDNIDRAAQTNVQFIIQPGGSTRDPEIIKAADEYGMVMVFTGLRLFYH
jgi:AICAR transformylase/IMP cyclohydrolase PurH